MEDKVKKYEELKIRFKNLGIEYTEIDLGDKIILGVDLGKLTPTQKEEVFKLKEDETRSASKDSEQQQSKAEIA